MGVVERKNVQQPVILGPTPGFQKAASLWSELHLFLFQRQIDLKYGQFYLILKVAVG